MNLLVVRHAIAKQRVAFAARGDSDDLRPLTSKGERRMRKGAKGLRRLVPEIDLLATSPLVRAADTAAILARAYGSLEPVVVEALRPERSADELLAWLAKAGDDRTVAIVGHEPALSKFVGVLLGSATVELGKGGACLIDFERRPGKGKGVLRWLLQPSQVRRLRR